MLVTCSLAVILPLALIFSFHEHLQKRSLDFTEDKKENFYNSTHQKWHHNTVCPTIQAQNLKQNTSTGQSPVQTTQYLCHFEFFCYFIFHLRLHHANSIALYWGQLKQCNM